MAESPPAETSECCQLCKDISQGRFENVKRQITGNLDSSHVCTCESKRPIYRLIKAYQAFLGTVREDGMQRSCVWKSVKVFKSTFRSNIFNIVANLLARGEGVNYATGVETPLMAAITTYDEQLLGLLLDFGADVNLSDGMEDMNALGLAILLNEVSLVEMLLQHGGHVNAACCGHLVPIQLAMNKNPAVSNLLIQYGADIHFLATVTSPSELFTINCPLVIAIIRKNAHLALLLLEHGEDVNQTYGDNLESPIHLAIREDDVSLVDTLIKYNADLNRTSTEGHTPLGLALTLDRPNGTEIAKRLVHAGAQPNSKAIISFFQRIYTPLHIACFKGNFDFVRFLVEDVCSQDGLIGEEVEKAAGLTVQRMKRGFSVDRLLQMGNPIFTPPSEAPSSRRSKLLASEMSFMLDFDWNSISRMKWQGLYRLAECAPSVDEYWTRSEVAFSTAVLPTSKTKSWDWFPPGTDEGTRSENGNNTQRENKITQRENDNVTTHRENDDVTTQRENDDVPTRGENDDVNTWRVNNDTTQGGTTPDKNCDDPYVSITEAITSSQEHKSLSCASCGQTETPDKETKSRPLREAASRPCSEAETSGSVSKTVQDIKVQHCEVGQSHTSVSMAGRSQDWCTDSSSHCQHTQHKTEHCSHCQTQNNGHPDSIYATEVLPVLHVSSGETAICPHCSCLQSAECHTASSVVPSMGDTILGASDCDNTSHNHSQALFSRPLMTCRCDVQAKPESSGQSGANACAVGDIQTGSLSHNPTPVQGSETDGPDNGALRSDSSESVEPEQHSTEMEPVFQKEFGAEGYDRTLWDHSMCLASLEGEDFADILAEHDADHARVASLLVEERKSWRRICFLNQRTIDGSTPLFMAVFSGNIQIVHYLLKAGAGANFECTHGNFFHAAVLSQNLDLVKQALDLGCNINHINAFGNSPLILVSRLDLPEMCRLLVENGADINARDRFRETPLLASVYFGCESNARVLIQHGAALDLVDDNNTSAIYWAIFNNRERTLKLLLLAGVRFTPEILARYPRNIRVMHNAPLYRWLQHHVSNPRSLRALCALRVRKHLCEVSNGMSILGRIAALPLPTVLKDILMLKDCLEAIDTTTVDDVDALGDG